MNKNQIIFLGILGWIVFHIIISIPFPMVGFMLFTIIFIGIIVFLIIGTIVVIYYELGDN